jgi:hypothetical protein
MESNHERRTAMKVSRGFVLAFFSGAILFFGVAPAAAQDPPQGRKRIKCESPSGTYKLCEAAVGGNVTVARQISDTKCVEGQTWGWNSRGIWVDKGCRADFEFDEPGQIPDDRRERRDDWRLVRREFYNSGYRFGKEDARLRLSRRHERYWPAYDERLEPSFRRGYYDGYDGREQERDPDEGSGGGSGDTRRLICESRDRRYTECGIERRSYVKLLRQLSGSAACSEGDSWGITVNQQAIWVDKGCRAEFEVSPRR